MTGTFFACLSAHNAGGPGWIPGSQRSAGEGIGCLLQYSWAFLWLSWQRICLQCRRLWFNSWVRKIRWRRNRLPTPVFSGFLCGSADKESACNAGDLGSIPGWGRSPEGHPLQYSDLENSMDCIVHGVAKSQTPLSNFHFQMFLLAFSNPVLLKLLNCFHSCLHPPPSQ